MAKIYIDNGRYMEFIDDIATKMTEIAYKGDPFIVNKDKGFTQFTDEAQDFYNERYDEVETILNRTLNIHSNEHLNTDN